MQDYESLKACSIKEGTLLLLKDIHHIYSDPISLKSTTFFSNLTEILYTIFGDEKNPGFKWLEKAYKDCSEADPNGNFRKYQAAENDLRGLIDLLSPPYRAKNSNNLFTLMSDPLTESKYLLNESKLPAFTQHLIASRNFDHPILQDYKKLFQHLQDPKNASYKFDLILSPFEFYLFVFIYSMKKFQSKSAEPKTPEDYGNNDLYIGLCTNPYLVLLRKYLEFFISELSWSSNRKNYFRKITFLIEEYLIHDLIYSSPQTFSKYLPSSNQLSLTRFYQIKQTKRQDFISKRIPSPHIHHAIYLVLHYLQKILSPFTEDSQASHFLLGMPLEDARSKYARLAYNYILNCLRYWTKDLNNPCNLADLGYVWLKYLRPWEILQPNIVDDLTNYSQSVGDTSQLALLRDVKAKYMNSSNEERDYYYLSHKEFYNTLNNYILRNLLFYTVLLKEFIIVFSEVNNLSVKDINFFQETIGLFFHFSERYSMEPYYEFLNGHVTFEYLRNLSLGPKKRIAPREIVERHIQEIGADYADLYFINDEAIKMRIVKLKDKFNKYLITLISSIKTHRDRYEPVIARLSKNITKIISVLNSTFEIRFNSDQAPSPQKNTRFREEGIRNTYAYDSRAYIEDPWLKPVGASDFFILYWFFYYIAKLYDIYIRRKKIDEKEGELYHPSLNLRGFSRKMNVYRFVGFIIILYFFFKLFIA